MDKKENKKEKYQLILGILFFLLAGILYLGQNGGQKKNGITTGHFADSADGQQKKEQTNQKPVQTSVGEKTNRSTVTIHICGAVKKPGVYTFQGEPHIVDVVRKAGGFTKKADQTSVNLAERAADGTQLVISAKGKHKVTNEEPNSHSESSGSGLSGKVNINTASEQELMTLSGIGESKASEIVSYRKTNGAFHQIEEIMNISGIKEGVFSKIKDYITV